MRKIGTLENLEKADLFRWYLVSQRIETKVEEIEEASLDVWIFHDRDLKKARDLYEQFQTAVDLSTFKKAAEAVRRTLPSPPIDIRDFQKKSKKQVRRHPQVSQIHIQATLGLISLSILFFMMHFLDKDRWLMRHLMISEDFLASSFGIKSFREITSGQIWRLYTPIFIHSDFFHIAFNMLWLYQFGRMIEDAIGGLRLLLLTLVIAVPSNLVFYLISGPYFGGMSGVVYGLFFFMWAHERYSLNSPFRLDPYLAKFFVIYYVLCWILTAIGMHVANSIHGVGAFAGAATAYIVTGAWRQLKKPRQSITLTTVYNSLIVLALLLGGIMTDILTK